MEVNNKTAVITGGGNGIGEAVALALAGAGANVVVADIEGDRAREVADAAAAKGVKSLGVQVDVMRSDQVEALAEQTWAEFGAAHILFNNAGVGSPRRPLHTVTEQDMEWVLGVNLLGVMHGIRAFMPRFVESEEQCRIINTGSEHSLGYVFKNIGIYTASKHAVLALSDVLRAECPEHVGVSVLCPGYVASSIWRSVERRPDEFGGAKQVDPARGELAEQYAMPAAEAAKMVLTAIREEYFYIFTHPHVVEYARRRWEEIEQAFAAQAPRYDGDDKYEIQNVTKAFAKQAQN